MTSSHPLAANPLPWIFTAEGFDLSRNSLTTALTELAEAGFDAVHAEFPADMPVDEYRDLLTEYGFQPAPGYFHADFTDPSNHAALIEAARVHASWHAELGLTETFIASDLSAPRVELPGLGTEASPERLARITDQLVAAAETMAAEGVTAALHSHVASWIETEAELRTVLDATAGSALAFGPDTGHLAWVGADTRSLFQDYGDRVAAVHVKDIDQVALRAARDAGADYWAATFGYHVWTEPGRGAIDFDTVFTDLPDSFGGWFIVEVDVPNLGSTAASNAAARSHLLQLPFFAGQVTR